MGCRRDTKELFTIEAQGSVISSTVLRAGDRDYFNRPPLPYEDWAIGPGRTLVADPSGPVRYAQYALTLVALVTGALAIGAIAMALTGPRVSAAGTAACTAALTAHGGLLLTALLAAGFNRFLLGLWPAIVMAPVLAAYWALRFGRPLRSTNF